MRAITVGKGKSKPLKLPLPGENLQWLRGKGMVSMQHTQRVPPGYATVGGIKMACLFMEESKAGGKVSSKTKNGKRLKANRFINPTYLE